MKKWPLILFLVLLYIGWGGWYKRYFSVTVFDADSITTANLVVTDTLRMQGSMVWDSTGNDRCIDMSAEDENTDSKYWLYFHPAGSPPYANYWTKGGELRALELHSYGSTWVRQAFYMANMYDYTAGWGSSELDLYVPADSSWKIHQGFGAQNRPFVFSFAGASDSIIIDTTGIDGQSKATDYEIKFDRGHFSDSLIIPLWADHPSTATVGMMGLDTLDTDTLWIYTQAGWLSIAND